MTDNRQERLEQLITSRKATVGILGMGYIGLPLALEKARAGYTVIGYDIKAERIESLKNGRSYIEGVLTDDLMPLVRSESLIPTGNPLEAINADIIVICLPAPLDTRRLPDPIYLEHAAEQIAAELWSKSDESVKDNSHEKQSSSPLIILESTAFPGATEDILLPPLQNLKRKAGKDFYLACCPHRVDPGNKVFSTSCSPTVVGGITENCTQMASLFYKSVSGAEPLKVSNPRTAEMSRMLENSFRAVNIALVNEMAVLSRRLNIDIWEVIEAAKTKPHGFLPFYPGPGQGGYGTSWDAIYLLWKAREHMFHPRLTELSTEINDAMPRYVSRRIGSMLNIKSLAIRDSKIMILGLSYKKNISDTRNSPALRLWEILSKDGAELYYHDPYIPSIEINGIQHHSTPLDEENVQKMNVVAIITDHSTVDYSIISKHAPLIFDTRNVMQRHGAEGILECL